MGATAKSANATLTGKTLTLPKVNPVPDFSDPNLELTFSQCAPNAKWVPGTADGIDFRNMDKTDNALVELSFYKFFAEYYSDASFGAAIGMDVDASSDRMELLDLAISNFVSTYKPC